MKWFSVEDASNTGKFAGWRGWACMGAHGTVFVAAKLSDNEDIVFRRAWDEGVSSITNGGHLYVPAEWMAREYPESAELCARITETMRAYVATIRMDWE